jgi:hypothetical protein
MAEKCKENHWHVEDGQLRLDTPNEEATDMAKQVIKTLEKQIRLQIYNDICDFKPLENRAKIMKISGGIDNALLGVQAICADIALGKTHGTN